MINCKGLEINGSASGTEGQKIHPCGARLIPAGNELAQNKHYIDNIIPPNSLGSRIKNLRLKQGMQQKDLAKRLGVSRACVCRYEKNS